MGTLVKGKWEINPVNSSVTNGEFVRQKSAFRDLISSDADAKFKAEKDRYHLYVSYACPWAHRTLILRSIKGLEDIISLSVVNPKMGEDGWSFVDSYPGATGDSLNHAQYLRDIYTNADKEYTGKATVPVLWDKKLKTIVNNESAEIIRMLNSAFNEFSSKPQLNLYPEECQEEIDQLNDYIYDRINNGVYKAGFATSQEAYDKNVTALFEALDQIEKRLENKKFLIAERLTETDIRLFTTLLRFDIVYFSHFKCNLQRIQDYQNLHSYLLNLYEIPEINKTVNFDHIKTHYYWSQESINPTRIVPKGPKQMI